MSVYSESVRVDHETATLLFDNLTVEFFDGRFGGLPNCLSPHRL